MPDKVTYYAIVNDLSSRERPAGVFRRTYTEDGGRSDEAFTRNLRWEYSTSLISAERGDLDNEFTEITEDEADQIVERIRARVTGASSLPLPLGTCGPAQMMRPGSADAGRSRGFRERGEAGGIRLPSWRLRLAGR
jgi:hypothetical protein